MINDFPERQGMAGNDIASLFSHFATFASDASRPKYHELVREEAALHAVSRWPLLAEIQGMDEATGTSE